MKVGYEYTDKNVEFGAAIDTPEIYFVTAIDIDKEFIKIPYKKKTDNVKELVDTYEKITSHRSMFKGRPCLRILNGDQRKKIADQKMSLMNLKVFFNQVCFRIEDSSNPNNDLSEVAQYIKESSSILMIDNSIEVFFSFQNKKFHFPFNKSSTIEKVIQTLQKNINEINFSKDDIILSLDGKTLNDKTITLDELELDGKEIKIYSIKKSGSFKGTTKILLADKTQKNIEQIKKDDLVYTFNRHTKQLEKSKVSEVYKTLVNESIVVKLQNGVTIQTMPNNLFLRHDGIFRLLQSQEKKQMCLAAGDQLKFYSGFKVKAIGIIKIENKLIPPEEFYNIRTESVQKGSSNDQNIIVEGIVSHHQFIKVKKTAGDIQSLDISISDKFSLIKQKLEAIYFLNFNHQRLIGFGKQLKDTETLMDKNISNETSVYLNTIPFSKFNLLHPNAIISLYDNNKKKVTVKDLKDNDEILCTDSTDFKIAKSSGKVISIKQQKVQNVIVLEYEGQSLKVCPETYIMATEGQILLASEMLKAFESKTTRFRMKIFIPGSEPAPIQRIYLQKKAQMFYKIESQALNFIVNDVIIPNSILKIVVQPNNKEKQSKTLNISHKTKIGDLKQIIEKQTSIPTKSQNIWFNNNFQFQDNKTLAETHLTNQSVVFIQQNKNKYASSVNQGINEEEHEKIISFLFVQKNKRYNLSYQLFKDWTIKRILSQYMKIQDSSYFLIYSNILIFSNEPLSKMETAAYFEQDNSVLVIRNQKLAFLEAMSINSQQINNCSCILFENQKILNKIPEHSKIKVQEPQELKIVLNRVIPQMDERISNKFLKRQHFYKPFLLLTSRKYHTLIHDYIKNFEEHRTEIDKNDSVFSIIKDLYQNMNLLTNHLFLCYYGIRNFRASLFMNVGYTFYLYNFTLSYRNKSNVEEELKGNAGTLFRIQSTSGKYISQFAINPDKKEILFAPFTYFLVENVIKGEGDQMDQVWITEVSSPITFNKSIILWVDDKPSNNKMEYNTILNSKPDLEILQVTSTAAAEKWMKEFGWILNWKGVQFKLISDMHRKEVKNGTQMDVPEAGIQLLQSLYVTKGYSAQTLIFCFQVQKAKEIAQKRNIPKERYIITNLQDELDRYLGIGPS